MHTRFASDTANQPSPLSQTHSRNPTVEDLPSETSSSTSTSIPYESSSSEDPRRTQILDELRHQMANWSVDPASQCPRDDRRNSSSTLPRQVDTAPIPLSAIQRHQRQNSNTSARPPLSQDELRYLAYVVEALATLVIASALSDEGVQYRNTFAWKFVVIPCPPPSPECCFPRVWLISIV